MKVLITGAAGFIGSSLIKNLQGDANIEIVAVDNVTDHNVHNVADLRLSNIHSINSAFESLSSSNSDLLNDCQIVIHQGAISSTVHADTNELMKQNFEFSRDLYEMCRRKSVRFIYASSASVYGKGERGFHEKPECELPLNVYGFSKLAFDNYIRNRGTTSQCVGLRYFNVYGPRESHKGKMASPFSQFTQQAIEKNEIKIFEGSENVLRDFVHVDDVVNVIRWCIENETVSGIFNVGTSHTASFLDVAQIVSERTGVHIKEIEFPTNLLGRYQKFTKAELGAIRSAGYEKNFLSIEIAGRRYVERILENS